MELARVVKQNIDISMQAEVLSYAYTGTSTREVLVRVDLGDTTKPIVGNGSYRLLLYIDDVEVLPVSSIPVPNGNIRAIMISRAIPLEPGDILSVQVLGLPGDTSIDSITSLRDATPITESDVFGSGTTIVDHNYGGASNLTVVTPGGAKVADANIWAFRSADYAAGNYTIDFAVAMTTTDINGNWKQPMMLDTGAYTLLVFKNGAIESKVVPLIVL